MQDIIDKISAAQGDLCLMEQVLWECREEILRQRSLLRLTRAFTERHDVLAFQQKFAVPMASEPAFLDEEAYDFRVRFMHEELAEFKEAHTSGDMHGAADALVDLTYIVHGTALMMGLPWPRLWNEVQRANMTKERATSAAQSKRGSALDVIKPAGWTPPDHTEALGKGPWPVFRRAETRDGTFTDSEGGEL